MSTFKRKEPEAQDHTWENVLLQISLAFTIIVGYLLSQNSAQVAQMEEQVQVSAEAVRKLRTTPAGEFAVGQVRAERESQRLRLLNEWWRLRPERPLYRALVRLRDVDRIHLDANAGYLPDDPAFKELLAERRRVFAGPGSDVAGEEIRRLLLEVCRRAGVHKGEPEALKALVRDAASQEALRDVLFDARTADPEALKAVAHAIRRDLLDERNELRTIQYLLVAQISLARLGTSPRAGISDKPGEVMRQFLEEVRAPLGLLEDVEKELLNAV